MAKRDGATGRDIVEVGFRGEAFEMDATAFRSLRVQTAMALAESDPAAANWAMDLICRHRLVEYLGRIPGEDGSAPGELGCSAADWSAFLAAVAEALSAKN